MARTTTGDRGRASRGDPEAATALLAENLMLLSGSAPTHGKLLAGRARVHHMALYWPATVDRNPACVQVLPTSPGAPAASGSPGWCPAEAQAIAESMDLRLKDEPAAGPAGGFTAWRRTTTPSYYLVLLDQSQPQVDAETLDRRCAALEAVYLEGAAWMRFHADRQFAEGSFTRLLQRVAYEVRESRTTADANPAPQQGLC